MLLDVIDDHALRLDPRVGLERIEDQPRALELVLEVRRVDEDELVVPRREVDVLLEHLQFVARVLVQPDLADAEHVRPVEKLRDDAQHFVRERHVLGSPSD